MARRLFGYITPNNTIAWDDPDTAGVVLHSTCVVFVDWAAGTVKLNSGGWQTGTTKRRMNEAARAFTLGFTVYSKDHEEWYVQPYGPDWDAEPIPFVDGMVLQLGPDGVGPLVCEDCGEGTASGGSFAGHVHKHGPTDHPFRGGHVYDTANPVRRPF